MAILTRLLWRLLYCCAVVFVSVSVVLTTNLLFISPLSSLVSRTTFSSLAVSSDSTFSTSTFPRAGMKGTVRQSRARDSGKMTPRKPVYVTTSERHFADRSTFDWTSSDFTLQHGLGYPGRVSLDEQTLLSKAFASSMRPSNVVPYFYRAEGTYDRNDITITTLITSNRFEIFERLVEKYQGPISVTVHIKDVAEHVQEVLESLHEMYTSSNYMMTFVDVHLVVDNFDRQFNTWRNIARLFARTDYVMMLDIDFYPCSDFRQLVNHHVNATMLDRLDKGLAALVIPAFEYVDFQEGMRYMEFPTNKSTLLLLEKAKRIRMFHASWAPGHNSTNYGRFYAAPEKDIYKVTQYQASYEPYIILRKDGPPWCDERFVGYGGNKAACLFEMYLAGVSYYVLADHFIIHQNHLYEEAARKNERKYNRKVYADFKEEICLRYLKRYYDSGIILSEYAENALAECKKIKAVVKTGKKYFRDSSRQL